MRADATYTPSAPFLAPRLHPFSSLILNVFKLLLMLHRVAKQPHNADQDLLTPTFETSVGFFGGGLVAVSVLEQVQLL